MGRRSSRKNKVKQQPSVLFYEKGRVFLVSLQWYIDTTKAYYLECLQKERDKIAKRQGSKRRGMIDILNLYKNNKTFIEDKLYENQSPIPEYPFISPEIPIEELIAESCSFSEHIQVESKGGTFMVNLQKENTSETPMAECVLLTPDPDLVVAADQNDTALKTNADKVPVEQKVIVNLQKENTSETPMAECVLLTPDPDLVVAADQNDTALKTNTDKFPVEQKENTVDCTIPTVSSPTIVSSQPKVNNQPKRQRGLIGRIMRLFGKKNVRTEKNKKDLEAENGKPSKMQLLRNVFCGLNCSKGNTTE